MKKYSMNPLYLATAASLLSSLASSLAQAQYHPEKPTYKAEKCYGIAKAGKNDCFTAHNACGQTSKVDNDPNAWKYVAYGKCTSLGGSLHAGDTKPSPAAPASKKPSTADKKPS